MGVPTAIEQVMAAVARDGGATPIDRDDWRSGSHFFMIAAVFPEGGMRPALSTLLRDVAAVGGRVHWYSQRHGRVMSRRWPAPPTGMKSASD